MRGWMKCPLLVVLIGSTPACIWNPHSSTYWVKPQPDVGTQPSYWISWWWIENRQCTCLVAERICIKMKEQYICLCKVLMNKITYIYAKKKSHTVFLNEIMWDGVKTHTHICQQLGNVLLGWGHVRMIWFPGTFILWRRETLFCQSIRY